MGIGRARTLIERYVYVFARSIPESVVWILDDDMRLDNLIFVPDGQGIRRERLDLLRHVARLKAAGYPIAIGGNTGEPPVPFSSTVRTQMVDLYHNLHCLARFDPLQQLPDRSAENAHLRQGRTDFYYDLSRLETDRLESPFWVDPARPGELVQEAFHRVSSAADRILAGEEIFRPLLLETRGDPLKEAYPSVRRGGNTFIFDLEALRDTPNATVSENGRESRRSEMMWAVLNRYVRGRAIVEVPLPVRQDRSMLPVSGLDLEKLLDDFRGYALYSSLLDLLERRREVRQRSGNGNKKDDLIFKPDDITLGVGRVRKYLQERLDAFTQSFYRVEGLTFAIRVVLDPARTPGAWWHKDEAAKPAIDRLRKFISRIESQYRPEVIQQFRQRVLKPRESEVRRLFESLRGLVEAHADFDANVENQVLEAFQSQRRKIALLQIRRLFHLDHLDYLGSGKEGVCFNDGHRVYKYLDQWSVRTSSEERAFLRSLVGQWKDTSALYPLLKLKEEGIHAVLIYPYEQGEPYRGGHGSGLLELLRECRQRGILCSNLHPDNLRVTPSGLRLIDYGSDIRPFSEAGFEQMCRRAWLTWRWHYRRDLKELMRRSLKERDLPEFDGYDRFRCALDALHADDELEELLANSIRGTGARSVLDYGCGKGRLAARLGGQGLTVTGFDPDSQWSKEWARNGGDSVRFGSRDLIESLLSTGESFDIVVCSRVVCTIEDDTEYRRVLRDLRHLVAPDGRVLLAICNPFFTLQGPTPLQRKRIPPDARYEQVFVWQKQLTATGKSRPDVHRSLDRIRRDLLRAGLTIEEMRETRTIDLDRFEKASDYLLLSLRPVPTDGPKVSLLIKTCVMEGRTIEHQVRHIVKQLEGPSTFHERILVFDSRADGFLRAYGPSEPKLHRQALDRLMADGVIDRVLYGPSGTDVVRGLYDRWFGLDATDTHAEGGQPVAATLTGFEVCSGDYILQVDSDVLVVRQDRSHDYLSDMVRTLEADPPGLTVSFNICHERDVPYSWKGPHGSWRVEVRAALFHRQRLLHARPFPNDARAGRLVLPWHRSIDRAVSARELHSYRGGDCRTYYIHPPNLFKTNHHQWMAVLDRVEQGYVPTLQRDQFDLQGSLDDWLGPKRSEPFIFVICGRNVSPGRFRRCLDSVLRQSRSDWGAVVVDDASDPAYSLYIERCFARYKDKITFLRLRERRGMMANLVWAIRSVCANPQSVILTLDADDCLLGGDVIQRVAREYESGADVTIGSMLGTDKQRVYVVDTEQPRRRGGGNVWQHLRTFRKGLFDSIPEGYLRSNGTYFDVATDWAYMVPIAELARHAVHIPDPLYLYEPFGIGKGKERPHREATIAAILAMKPLGEGRNS
ncbi:MAG: glycosyltransferase [Planctomycetota bacterium]|nr:glycosyltransferase [Planctomycetota bacterium]